MQRDLALFIGSLILMLVIGVFAGELHGRSVLLSAKVPLMEPDTRPLVPVVTIENIHDDLIHGTASGHVRIFGGEHVATIASGSFVIPLKNLQRVVTLTIPDGMRFVASKNGKKYYSVSSPSGMRIAPKNRVYFPDAVSAEGAGYKK